jgi:hypothetical protein
MRVLEIQRGGVNQRIATYLTDDEIGRLAGIPPEAVIGVVDDDDQLRVNSLFREFLHTVIGRFAALDPDMQAVAQSHGDGRLVYVDSRLPESVDPVPDEDVIGWFQVRSGAIVPGSYLPNPHHRIENAYGLSAAIGAMRQPMVAELSRR